MSDTYTEVMDKHPEVLQAIVKAEGELEIAELEINQAEARAVVASAAMKRAYDAQLAILLEQGVVTYDESGDVVFPEEDAS